MNLASVAAIRTDLGFDDMTNINAAISGAMLSTETILSAVLGTPFRRATYADTFYVPEPPYENGALRRTELLLKAGFVQTISSLVKADALLDLSTSSALDWSTNFSLNPEKGTLIDLFTPYYRSFIRIEYDAGFSADGVDPDSYDLTQVPGWLQEAAKLNVLLQLSRTSILNEAGIDVDTDTIKMQLQSTLKQHMRYAPQALLPQI